MEDLMLDIINDYGYIGIFLLITIENLFPPIPSEVILTFGGFLTTFSQMGFWEVAISATLGSVLGAIILYSIGRLLTIERIYNLIDSNIGKRLHLKKEDVGKAGKWFNEYENKAVFICRFVPIVRSLISIPAGISKMKMGLFVSLTAIGSFIWNAVLIYLGRVTGKAWHNIVDYMDFYTKIVVIIFIIISIVLGTIFVKRRFIKNKY
ncbi:DedA family protein [Tepidimicrobium xylanilyticum]|uniref:Membrane protein DedA, SNARE-associated domain n=1 Tax=Tepidimicrobium xylanilyticum TaxID=1123352 RepID=A0A1H3APT6_9FIRM|nr:DedA family protein [Tepidimicrobium xylanilyticum]SDX31421.1 membrane protein DedA, SNARE-associated domain [Tepidimicrobium xylanilyticum]